MTWIRHLALPTALLVLGLAATPANATFLVRSDGAGLFVQDKNGRDDSGYVGTTTRDGQTVYQVENRDSTDFFKFDRQSSCFEGDFSFMAECLRFGPVMNVQLAGGNDVFSLEGAPTGLSSIAAGTGNDHVRGHAGRDQPDGQSGEDTLIGLAGNDDLEGGPAFDRLFGGPGNDILKGEDGNDVLRGDTGDDVLRGGSGNDFLAAREPSGTPSVDDAVDCGSGFDAVETDLKDSVQADCEEVDEAPVGETPNVDVVGKTLRVASAGRVRVRLRCPRGVRSLGCNGRLQLRLGRASASGSRSVRYRIKAGRRKTVTLTLSAADVRALRRKSRRGVLTSVEKGRIGPKTTIRNPKLRVR